MPRTRSGGGYSMPGKKHQKGVDDQDIFEEEQEEQEEERVSDDQEQSTSALAKHQQDLAMAASGGMFDLIDRNQVNHLADRLYDIQEMLHNEHPETATVITKVAEINRLVRDNERQEKLNSSHHSSNASLSSITHSSPQIIMATTSDPNLVVEPWDGTASGYYKFEKRFVSTYVNNSAYSPANCFTAFAKLIGPKGRDLIEDLDQTTDGLNTAMERVKEQFDGPGLGALISATESAVKVLQQAGIGNDYIHINYVPDIDKLVKHLRDKVDGIHKCSQLVSTGVNVAAASKARINAVAASSQPNQQGPKSPRSPNAGPVINHSSRQPRNSRSGQQSGPAAITCRLCEGNHHSFSCNYGSVEDRKRLAASKQFCVRCLLRHPGIPCRSSYVCPCGDTHTRVLCPNTGARTPNQSFVTNSNQQGGGQSNSQQNTPPPSTSQSGQTTPKSGITMSIPSAGAKHSSTSDRHHLKYSRPELLTTYYETVVVKINNEMVRVQLDSGAGRTLILQDLADRLRLRHYSKHSLNLGGFDGLSSQSSERLVTANLNSIKSRHSFRMIMCVTPRIDHRPRSVSRQLWDALQTEGYELSDSPEYDQLPISIVVGAEYYRLLFRGNYVSYTEDLSLRPSIFGWVLTGTTEDERRSNTRKPATPFVGLINPSSQPEDEVLYQSLESASLATPTPDAKLALANSDFLFAANSTNDSRLEDEFNQEFMDNKVSLKDGRYTVKLEWIEPIDMGDNKQVALIRHHRLERSLEARNLTLDYAKELGEMVRNFTEPAEEPCKSRKCYYMPHHPVVRMDKETTKMRVVFDASSHATGTKPLNDNLFKGIVKVDPDDRDAFRFWWRDETGQLTTRRFTAVPFGTSISPYLLYIVFSHLFKQMESKYPAVVSVVKDRMYVDDVIVAFQDAKPEDLEQFCTQCTALFKEASMNLRKFRTNHQQLDEQWAGPDRAEIAKVLGHAWTVLVDTFAPSIDIGPYQTLVSLTKREFTAFVQSVYNPTGIVAPFNLKLKLALRELWALKLRWDEPIPESNLQEALGLIRDAQLVNSMVAPRNVLPDDDSVLTLRIYADASEKAVAVVAYCCSSKGNFHILAKTKLARSATMPELELDALGMAAAVANHLTFVHPFSRVVICGDSKCNLQRLQQHLNKQKPSIALRIRKISKLAPTATFRHVTTKENLADIASRGATMAQLVKVKQWLEAGELPSSTQFEHTLSSQVMTVSTMPTTDPNQCRCTRYATYQLAVGTYRYVARLLKRMSPKYDDLPELDLALIFLIREVQQNHFQHHIADVDAAANITFDKQSLLRNFGAHLDQHGLVRLRTRIEQSVNFSYEEVHPIILPPHCHFSRLVIANTHHQLFHPGVERTCSSIRERFFIINQRRMVKHFVNNCQICRRKRHTVSTIRHGPVPAFRYDVSSPPFTNTGIDLFGPVKVPMEGDAKVYGVIYVCATSRLVYIDAIPDMTAESVFKSVTQFVARNGLPRMFYSDNGKQLIKVKNDLQKYLEEMSLKRPDQEYRFQWQHLTAHSPWKGGFYERLNRSIKEALATFSLDRTVSTQSIAGRVNGKKAKLTLDQLKYVFAEIESMINNRPLFEHEGKVIRPVDFRAGQGSLQMPIACNLPARYQKPNIIRDYKAFQAKVNHYRSLWKSHYILELRNFHQHTEKQTVPRRFEIGDVVHVRSPSSRLDQWPLGIVTHVFTSSDGISRSVKVRTLSRGNVVEETKDVRNLVPTEANQERHDYHELDSTPDQDPVQDAHQTLDSPDPRLRATASRVARLQPKRKESLEKLAKKWSRVIQLKQKDAVHRQKLRDLISGSLAKGKPKDDPQIILSAASAPLQPVIKQRGLRSLQQCAFRLRAEQIVSSQAAASTTVSAAAILKQSRISRIPLVYAHTLGHGLKSVTCHSPLVYAHTLDYGSPFPLVYAHTLDYGLHHPFAIKTQR
ncbi:hypothetical protein TYRP_008885 [Tyrophagus putrescentiae]|nr:hypothetical protein TYRP_008885 [Tyrophagus putrescentiae]